MENHACYLKVNQPLRSSEVINLREMPTSSINSFHLNICPHSHRKVQSWTLIKETSAFQRWKKLQKPVTNLSVAVHSLMDSDSTPKPQGILWKKWWKDYKKQNIRGDSMRLYLLVKWETKRNMSSNVSWTRMIPIHILCRQYKCTLRSPGGLNTREKKYWKLSIAGCQRYILL